MQPYAIMQSRPVFVTSTFRDMHAERYYLHNLVFPEREERLKDRFHHLKPVGPHYERFAVVFPISRHNWRREDEHSKHTYR